MSSKVSRIVNIDTEWKRLFAFQLRFCTHFNINPVRLCKLLDLSRDHLPYLYDTTRIPPSGADSTGFILRSKLKELVTLKRKLPGAAVKHPLSKEELVIDIFYKKRSIFRDEFGVIDLVCSQVCSQDPETVFNHRAHIDGPRTI